jgi:hypothetical protein
VSYEPLNPSKLVGTFDWLLGYLNVTAATSPVASGPLGFKCPSGNSATCMTVPNGNPADPIAIEGRQCGANGERNAEPICFARIAGKVQWIPIEEFEDGSYSLRVTQSPLASGYLPSEASAALSFTPEVIFPACDEENGGPWC